MTLRSLSSAGVVAAALLTHASASSADTLVVSPSGPLRSVAEAVRTAPAGSLVIVRAGHYREPAILIDRPLTVEGEGQPVIEPAGEHTLIRVVADGVTLRGLVLANVPASHVDDRAALTFEGVTGCVAERLEIRNTPFGIYASDSSDCRIVNNVVRGGGAARRPLGNAIHLWSSRGMTVARNLVTGHRDGLYFEFVQDTTVDRNVSEANDRYGLHFMFSHRCAYRDNRFVRNGAGVAVMYTREVAMERNEFADNRGPTAYGLLLKDISDSRLVQNRFADNTVGLLIEGGGQLTVEENRFLRNGWAVRLMANSPRNRFAANTFDGNSFDMTTNSRSTEAVVSGNWWDRYRGYDLDRDGRGDVAFQPVRLFSLLVARNPSSVILMRSAFVDLLDTAERALPILTPDTLADDSPLMERPR
jgi:nitrous oxidase accessory protein